MASVFQGSHLLMAVGRKVNIAKLDLDKAGIAHDRAVTGRCVFAHLEPARLCHRRRRREGCSLPMLPVTTRASSSAQCCSVCRRKQRTDHIPWATYTDPELAQVGLTEAEAHAKNMADKLEITRFDYSGNDRAIAEGKTGGLVKVMVVRGPPRRVHQLSALRPVS